MLFAAEFEPALATGSRGAVRAPVSMDARIGRGAYDRALCRVTDLSRSGACIEAYSALKPGTLIWLTLPTIGQHVATVIWADDFEAGCRFVTPLDEQAFESLVALHEAITGQ